MAAFFKINYNYYNVIFYEIKCFCKAINLFCASIYENIEMQCFRFNHLNFFKLNITLVVFGVS